MKDTFRITVPASSANLGPGFDCLGVAIGLHHQLTVHRGPGTGTTLHRRGEGAGEELPSGADNLVLTALRSVLAERTCGFGHLTLESTSRIPLASGLGSSAAAVVCGLAAGMLLADRQVDLEQLIAMGTAMEGHPDNIVPCVAGGFTVAVWANGRVEHIRLDPPPGIRAVLVIPSFGVSTRAARAVLPHEIPRVDAVANLGRAALLTAAIAAGRLDCLRTAMRDCLHEPYRNVLIPGLEAVCESGREAGALGTALSGAGPSIIALAGHDAERVGAAMQACWARMSIAARYLVLPLAATGVAWEWMDN